MSDSITAVLEQLEDERARLARLLSDAQAQADSYKNDLDRIERALSALTNSTRPAPVKNVPTRTDLHSAVRALLSAHHGGMLVSDLRNELKQRLRAEGKSARGLHKSLPHVLRDSAFRVDRDLATLSAAHS